MSLLVYVFFIDYIGELCNGKQKKMEGNEITLAIGSISSQHLSAVSLWGIVQLQSKENIGWSDMGE